MVLFTSFDKTDEVEGLPFALESESARMYLSNNKGVKNLFGFIGAKNTLKGENACIYYHLNDNLFYKIEYDVFFVNVIFQNSLSARISKPNTELSYWEKEVSISILC